MIYIIVIETNFIETNFKGQFFLGSLYFPAPGPGPGFRPWLTILLPVWGLTLAHNLYYRSET